MPRHILGDIVDTFGPVENDTLAQLPVRRERFGPPGQLAPAAVNDHFGDYLLAATLATVTMHLANVVNALGIGRPKEDAMLLNDV